MPSVFKILTTEFLPDYELSASGLCLNYLFNLLKGEADTQTFA